MPEIYLSMTTRPERLSSNYFKDVLKSLEKQSMPFTKLVINLCVNEFTYNIPEYIVKHKKIILNKTNICGPCAKVLGSVLIIPPEAVTIVLDDDIIMRRKFIESLYTSYLLNPDKVTSHVILKRAKWTDVHGFAGFIYKTKLLKNIRKFYKTQPPCCVKIDDTWLGWCIKKLGVEVVQTQEKKAKYKILNNKETANHPNWYQLWTHTERAKLTEEAVKILESRM